MSSWWIQKIRSIRKATIGRYYWAGMMHEMRYDWDNTGNLTWGQKIWAYRRGFLAYRITEYGLTDENYRQYMPDFPYYRLHPLNGKFSFWIDDKLTMKYILHPFNSYLPKYYFYIVPGGITSKLMDCPPNYGTGIDDILALLAVEKNLAAKLISGSRGQGFVKLTCWEDRYYINDQLVSLEKIKLFLLTKQQYIITEYLVSHPDLAKIWSGAASSVRIVVYRNKFHQTRIAGAYLKFGTSATGPVDNLSAGGISAHVDLDHGTFDNGRFFTADNEMKAVAVHPDSGVAIQGVVPFWHEIKNTLYAIGDYLPQLRYMGYDIVIGADGFKIVEINSLSAIDILNYYRPLLTDPEIAEFFNCQYRP